MNTDKKVLLFQIKNENLSKIKEASKSFKITIENVSNTDYNETLGALVGISGIKRINKKYYGTVSGPELMVLSGFDSESLDDYLAELKKAGVPSSVLKATVTPANVYWSFQKLYSEIVKEHQKMNSNIIP